MRSFKLGRISGVDVFLHPSWFIVLFIFTMGSVMQGDIVGILCSTIMCIGIYASVLGHEFAHIFTARRYGIGTHKVVLHIFGGIAYLRKMPFGIPEAVVAVAGPIFSLILGVALYGVNMAVGYEMPSPEEMGTTLWPPWLLIGVLGYINLIIGGINLLPIFPMDGGRIFRGIIMHCTKRIVLSTRIVVFGGLLIGMPLAFILVFDPNLWTILLCGFIMLLGLSELKTTETLYRDGRGKPSNLDNNHVHTYTSVMQILGPDDPVTQSIRQQYSSPEFDIAATNIEQQWRLSGKKCELTILANKLSSLGVALNDRFCVREMDEQK